jgi:hypothetical protein
MAYVQAQFDLQEGDELLMLCGAMSETDLRGGRHGSGGGGGSFVAINGRQNPLIVAGGGGGPAGKKDGADGQVVCGLLIDGVWSINRWCMVWAGRVIGAARGGWDQRPLPAGTAPSIDRPCTVY